MPQIVPSPRLANSPPGLALHRWLAASDAATLRQGLREWAAGQADGTVLPMDMSTSQSLSRPLTRTLCRCLLLDVHTCQLAWEVLATHSAGGASVGSRAEDASTLLRTVFWRLYRDTGEPLPLPLVRSFLTWLLGRHSADVFASIFPAAVRLALCSLMLEVFFHRDFSHFSVCEACNDKITILPSPILTDAALLCHRLSGRQQPLLLLQAVGRVGFLTADQLRSLIWGAPGPLRRFLPSTPSGKRKPKLQHQAAAAAAGPSLARMDSHGSAFWPGMQPSEQLTALLSAIIRACVAVVPVPFAVCGRLLALAVVHGSRSPLRQGLATSDMAALDDGWRAVLHGMAASGAVVSPVSRRGILQAVHPALQQCCLLCPVRGAALPEMLIRNPQWMLRCLEARGLEADRSQISPLVDCVMALHERCERCGVSADDILQPLCQLLLQCDCCGVGVRQ